MAAHSSILAGRILWTEERARLQSMGSTSSDATECACIHTHSRPVYVVGRPNV